MLPEKNLNFISHPAFRCAADTPDSCSMTLTGSIPVAIKRSKAATSLPSEVLIQYRHLSTHNLATPIPNGQSIKPLHSLDGRYGRYAEV